MGGAHLTFRTVISSSTETDHVLNRKINLSEPRETEIVYSVFSDYDWIKVNIQNKKTSENSIHIWKLNSIFLNIPWFLKNDQEARNTY